MTDDGALVQRQVRVRDEQVGVDLQLAAQPLAFRAGAVRRVERKGARLDLRQHRAVLRAGQVLGEMQVVPGASGLA